jgi:hypothetical protein
MQAIFNATEEFILSIDELNNEVYLVVYCLVMLALYNRLYMKNLVYFAGCYLGCDDNGNSSKMAF